MHYGFSDGGCSSVVESRIVIPVVVGSIPISHPIKIKALEYFFCPFLIFLKVILGNWKVVQDNKPVFLPN